MAAKKGKPRAWNQVFLGLVGVLLLAAGFFGALNGLSDIVAGALIVVGGGLCILAAFWSRIYGDVELKLNGFKLSVARAEQQVEEDETSSWPPFFWGSPTAVASDERDVRIVADLFGQLLLLGQEEGEQVSAEIMSMRRPDFRVEADPVMPAGDQGRSYRVHEVPDSNVRLWYRPLSEADPETLVVIAIDKKD